MRTASSAARRAAACLCIEWNRASRCNAQWRHVLVEPHEAHSWHGGRGYWYAPHAAVISPQTCHSEGVHPDFVGPSADVGEWKSSGPRFSASSEYPKSDGNLVRCLAISRNNSYMLSASGGKVCCFVMHRARQLSAALLCGRSLYSTMQKHCFSPAGFAAQPCDLQRDHHIPAATPSCNSCRLPSTGDLLQPQTSHDVCL